MGVEPGLGEAAAEAGVQGFAQKRREPLGEAELSISPGASALRKEPGPGQEPGTKFLPSARLPSFLSWAVSPSPDVTEDAPQEELDSSPDMPP